EAGDGTAHDFFNIRRLSQWNNQWRHLQARAASEQIPANTGYVKSHHLRQGPNGNIVFLVIIEDQRQIDICCVPVVKGIKKPEDRSCNDTQRYGLPVLPIKP